MHQKKTLDTYALVPIRNCGTVLQLKMESRTLSDNSVEDKCLLFSTITFSLLFSLLLLNSASR